MLGSLEVSGTTKENSWKCTKKSFKQYMYINPLGMYYKKL